MQESSPFKPFSDRLSRDIRNDLSRAFAHALQTGSLDAPQKAAKRYLAIDPPAAHRRYISDRLRRYEHILERQLRSPATPLKLAFRLWDEGLFFEVHEILEPLWLRAQGEKKLLLQALIRAAGVYIKLEAGSPETAARIAAKALPVLERNRDVLAQHIETDTLITALTEPTLPAPLLLPGEARHSPDGPST